MPPPINVNKGSKAVSIAVGVTCAVIGVVIIALLVWWCIRWQKAKNPYAFVETK